MANQKHPDSFKTRSALVLDGHSFTIYRLPQSRLPVSLRILLENLLRLEDGGNVKRSDIEALIQWNPAKKSNKEIAFMPARVLLQDFTGVPAVVDFAAMRDAITKLGGEANVINPVQPADLVIDHSVQVHSFGTADSFRENAEMEFQANRERYQFLKWGQQALKNFRVVPPDTGICHQVNLEYLARVVMEQNGVLYPDTLVGTDSHTTMINGLGVLGWGVGGIEAEAAMLGQPISMLIPEVIGFKLHGQLKEGVTATDLVLTVTEMLRKKGVVGKFVEFYGSGLSKLSLADRATVANMAPEYGATAAYFPVDQETLNYLRLTGRDEKKIKRVELYYREQNLFRTDSSPDPMFSDTLALDLGTVESSLAGPRRPQDRVPLGQVKSSFQKELDAVLSERKAVVDPVRAEKWADEGGSVKNHSEKTGPAAPQSPIEHGAVVIAAITSCTNTSNPAVMMGAGLLAKKAIQRGLTVKPWVKTSLAPGSKVVMDYLKSSGLIKPLEELKFNLVGYGCTTCIGNSGPLPEHVQKAVKDHNLIVAAVLSGNRNFEGRINPAVHANYLASPPLVVAYAIAGTMNLDLTKEPLAKDPKGKPVFLRDIWPSQQEVNDAMKHVTSQMFGKEYAHVFEGDEHWASLDTATGNTFQWDPDSSYVKNPPFFTGMPSEPDPRHDILNARVLAVLGDSVTTDHISPAGSIAKDSPAGKYLMEQGIQPKDFNSYGARRGNYEVMVRGTFANIRLKNLLVPGTEGWWTRHFPDGDKTTIYDASVRYKSEQVPLIVLAGKEYGSGSSRDWAAKGPALLGIQAVIAQSFERIHRSNLIGMGILPLEFSKGESCQSLGLTGEEIFDITGIENNNLSIAKELVVTVRGKVGKKKLIVLCRIDTPAELNYYQHGGILHYVLRSLVKK